MKNKTDKTAKNKKIAKDIVETLQYGEAKKKRMDKIRQRASYGYFEKIWFNLPKKLSKETKSLILLQIWRGIDNYRGFRYERLSVNALESIEQLMKDRKANIDLKNFIGKV